MTTYLIVFGHLPMIYNMYQVSIYRLIYNISRFCLRYTLKIFRILTQNLAVHNGPRSFVFLPTFRIYINYHYMYKDNVHNI